MRPGVAERPKDQAPTSREAPNFNIRNMYRAILLELGYWNFSGAWMLVLGAFALKSDGAWNLELSIKLI
jgi:hypothetical protein